MIVQNNPVSWVFLALIIMVGCVAAGMLMSDAGPFNPETAAAKIQITQTQASINAGATQSALELIQTQQAPLAQQTVMVAQMTAAPLLQTATHIAELDALQVAQGFATQTAIADQAQMSQLMAHATQTAIANGLYNQEIAKQTTATAIAQQQTQENTSNIAYLAVVGVGTLSLCGWLISRSIAQALSARAQEMTARANLLAEQRRLASLRASLQTQRGAQSQQYPVPSSLMQRPGNGKGLPKA